MPLVALDDDVLRLAPPGALDPLRDVAAAVGEALRYPLSGPPLSELVTVGGRATIVVEPRSLPFPGAQADPRQVAVAAVIDELERLGLPADRHTILIAGGLERRAGRRELDGILPTTRARDFRGTIAVHDAAATDLQPLDPESARPIRAHPALLAADLIVSVSAAETSEHGGDCTLLGACAAATIASAAPAASLLAPSLSPAGVLAGTGLGGARTTDRGDRRLDRARSSAPDRSYRGYPSSPAAIDALARSPLRRVSNVLPGVLREHLLQRAGRELTAVAILAGPPAVSHAEALLRGIALRGVPLAGQLDTIVVPIAWKSPHEPWEPPNPITAAALGLGHALRLWRDDSPLREGGTVVLLHDLRRTFRHGQTPYRDLFHVLREGGTPVEIAAAREAASASPRGLAAYRKGEAPHPLLPYLDWASCEPAIARAGRVLVAGCRDAGAARALGLVPTHSIPVALEMARGVAGGSHRLGVFVGPPYVPLILGG